MLFGAATEGHLVLRASKRESDEETLFLWSVASEPLGPPFEDQAAERRGAFAASDGEPIRLHAQHHPHGVLETRRLPPKLSPSDMASVEDFALAQRQLVNINPGSGEYARSG